MDGFRQAGDRKRALIQKLQVLTQVKANTGVNIIPELNRLYPNRSIKSLPETLTTKELTGLISYIYSI